MVHFTFENLRGKLCAILCTLLFFILFPVTMVALVPVYVVRLFVSMLAKVYRPDFGRLVHTRSSVLAIDNAYEDPKWNLCVWLIIEGSLNFENFRENFLKNIVNRKGPTGDLLDPEYQQYYTTWLGFLFWKWDRAFSIKNHMRYYYGQQSEHLHKETTEEELRQIIKKLTWAPFEKRRSPWEFLYIPKYKSRTDESKVEPKCVLIFRLHHGLCDGYKILHLLMKETNAISLDYVARPDVTKRSPLSRIFLPLAFCIRAPYELMDLLVSSKDTNDWRNLDDQQLVKPMSMGFTKRIPLAEIKNVKNAHGVSFTAVLLACITGGIRRAMIRAGARVPPSISTAIAVPMPKHPTRLRNHFIFSFIKLPVGISDPRQRLLKMEQNIRNLKASMSPLFSFQLVPVVGGMMSWMMGCFNNNIYSTALLSNFPGPPDITYFIADGGSHKVTDMNFAAGLGAGGVGLGFLMMSYADGIRVISQADQGYLKDDAQVDTLNENIVEELTLLKLDQKGKVTAG